MKYKFFHNGTTTIAVSTYAGKTVKGYAKTDPRDSYDESYGEKLAALRCNVKVAEKRLKRAKGKMAEARVKASEAMNYWAAQVTYYMDATEAYVVAMTELKKLLDK
jgi:hypothetical protein